MGLIMSLFIKSGPKLKQVVNDGENICRECGEEAIHYFESIPAIYYCKNKHRWNGRNRLIYV